MSNSSVDVHIFDTTLRDGAQSLPESNQFPYGTKTEIAEHIAGLGINVIEAGFPRTSGDADEVRNVAKTVGNTAYQASTWRNGTESDTETFVPVITGLSRTTAKDVDTAWDAVQDAFYPRIHTFISTDHEHMATKFPGKTPEQVRLMGVAAVRHAKSLVEGRPGASVEFSAEAASTTQEAYLERVVKSVIDEGADIINLPDTVGQRNPFWMQAFYAKTIDWVMRTNPDVTISAHNHNDLDMATINSLSLIMAAARYAEQSGKQVKAQIETTISGLGERAGNADVFSVVAGLFKFSDQFGSDIQWRFNPGSSVSTARAVLSFAGLEVHRQSPIVGNDILAHRSGIHSDGIIKGGHRIYTPHDPTFWGHPTNARHEEGRYQGTKGRQFIDKL